MFLNEQISNKFLSLSFYYFYLFTYLLQRQGQIQPQSN